MFMVDAIYSQLSAYTLRKSILCLHFIYKKSHDVMVLIVIFGAHDPTVPETINFNSKSISFDFFINISWNPPRHISSFVYRTNS